MMIVVLRLVLGFVRAVLGEGEALLLEGTREPHALEGVVAEGDQRLPHAVAPPWLLLEDRHAAALLGQHGRRGAACGPATNDDGVEVVFGGRDHDSGYS